MHADDSKRSELRQTLLEAQSTLQGILESAMCTADVCPAEQQLQNTDDVPRKPGASSAAASIVLATQPRVLAAGMF